MLTRDDLTTAVFDALGETSSNSAWSTSDVVRAINRETRSLAGSVPLRVAALVIEGDGAAVSFDLDEPVERVITVVENNALTPQITFADAVAAVFGRSLLSLDLYSSFGWAFEAPNRIRIQPVLQVGDKRTVYAMAGCGWLRDTSYTTGTVAATNGSRTVTGSGTAWSANASKGDTISVAGRGYVIASVESDTQITLSEQYREPTASGLSYEIGGHLIAPDLALDLIAYHTAVRLALNLGDDETAARNLTRARRELRRYRGRYERLSLQGLH